MNQQPAHTERAKHAAVRSSIYLTPLLCKLQDHTSDIIICVWLSDMTKDYILSREIGQLGPCFVTRPRSQTGFHSRSVANLGERLQPGSLLVQTCSDEQ